MAAFFISVRVFLNVRVFFYVRLEAGSARRCQVK
jgi:hypothetical protein